jgi:hypothetical protein
MFKPGTLIALKSFLMVPGKEPCVYMVLDCELDPGDLQYYSLRYKVLNPDGIIEHISNPSMFWFEAIT